MVQTQTSLRVDVAQLLANLVAIESVNPYFPGGDRGEIGVATYVSEFCTRAGLNVRQQPVLPGRANVLADLKVEGATRTLVLDSHMDTVSLDQMGLDGLQPRVRDGRMTGRGSCDDKASLAAMMIAIARLAADPAGLRANVLLLATADEEYLMRGAQSFARSGIKVDGVIVGEPTGLDVVVAHKGFLRWKFHAVGRAAHSSNPRLGDNAIYQMAEFLGELRVRLDAILVNRVHPLVGPATWSVGKISGGSAVNIVPDRCTVEVDRRLLPGESGAGALAEIDAVVQEIVANRPGLRIERDDPFGNVLGLETPPSDPVVQAMETASKSIRGQSRIVGVPYGTNASKFSEAGIPCVVFGPGHIEQAHTAEEFVPLDQVTVAAQMYEAAARSF